MENRKVFFSRKRSLSKFNDLLFDIKHSDSRRKKQYIDPIVTEKERYIQIMQSNQSDNPQPKLIGDSVTDIDIVKTNKNELIPPSSSIQIVRNDLMPSILTENRLNKLSDFVSSYLLSDSFSRQSDGTTDLVLYGNKSSKELVQRKINELAKSCFTLLVGDKKLPLVLWQFPWIYWKVFTLTQSRAWEDFNKPGLLWVYGPEKWRTLKATQFLQTFLDVITK